MMMALRSKKCWLPLLLLVVLMMPTVTIALRIPRLLGKKEYTPLLFFKVPPGLIPECDEMEKTVRDVEKELGVKVERVDVARFPENEALMALVTERSPPFLYHRESCQSVHIQPRDGNSAADMPIVVDKDRVRAWAKGRYLGMQKHALKVKTPIVVAQEDKAVEQEELLEDLTMSDLQREGKKAIKERTESRTKS